MLTDKFPLFPIQGIKLHDTFSFAERRSRKCEYNLLNMFCHIHQGFFHGRRILTVPCHCGGLGGGNWKGDGEGWEWEGGLGGKGTAWVYGRRSEGVGGCRGGRPGLMHGWHGTKDGSTPWAPHPTPAKGAAHLVTARWMVPLIHLLGLLHHIFITVRPNGWHLRQGRTPWDCSIRTGAIMTDVFSNDSL